MSYNRDTSYDDQPQGEGMIEKVKKLIPGTQEHREHENREQGSTYSKDTSDTYTGTGTGYTGTGTGYTGTGTGYTGSGTGYTGSGTGYTGSDTGMTGTGTGYTGTGTGLTGTDTGYTGTGYTGGSGMGTGGGYTGHPVREHVPGTEAHREREAMKDTGMGTGYTGGSGGTGAGYTGTGVGSGMGSYTNEPVREHVPGTRAHREREAMEDTGMGTGYTAGTGTGYTAGTGTGYTGTGTGTGMGTGTGGGYTGHPVREQMPGTEAHRERKAMKDTEYASTGTGTGYGTGTGTGYTTGTGMGDQARDATRGVTEDMSTMEKLKSKIPGTKEHKIVKEAKADY